MDPDFWVAGRHGNNKNKLNFVSVWTDRASIRVHNKKSGL
jgi:quinol monooxygenase YgiN